MNSKILAMSVIVVMMLGSLYPAIHAAPNLSTLSDNFRQDSSLNTSLWQINGSPGAIVANTIGPSAVTANTVTPVLAFSSTNGMAVTGVSGQDQSSTIQSVQTFTAPFTAQATVMSPAAFGNPFLFFITSSDGGTGAGLIGNLNPANAPFYGLWEITGQGVGKQWCCVGPTGTSIIASPSINVWYQLSIAVDSSGQATLGAGSAGGSGSATAQVGTGPFFLNLAQYEGAPNPLGPNEADWQSAQVFNPSSSNLIGPVINSACSTTSNPCEVSLPAGPNPDFTQTYTAPAQTTYLYAATDDGTNDVSWIPCCGTGTNYIGLDLNIINQNGFNAGIIGHSFGNTAWASYATPPFTPVAGGVGVPGQYTEAFSYTNQGQAVLSGSFSIPNSALVVLVSSGSNVAKFVSAVGPFVIDGSGSSGGSIAFGHATLASGQYTFTLNYQSGTNAKAEAIGAMVYIFTNPGQSLAVPFSLSLSGASVGSAVELTSGSVILGSTALPLSGSSAGGGCENESSSFTDTVCLALGSFFYHLAGTSIQVGSYFMSVGACYTSPSGNTYSLTFVPGWPPYCSGPTQITFNLEPCGLTHIDLPRACAITGQIHAMISATGTVTFSGNQATISAQGTAVETIPGTVIPTAGIIVSPLFPLFDIQAKGHLNVFLQVNETDGSTVSPINNVPIQLQSSLGAVSPTPVSEQFLGVDGIVTASFDLSTFTGSSFSVQILTTSFQGMTVKATKNPLVYNLTPRTTDLTLSTTLSGSASGIIFNAQGDVTHQFTLTNDGTNILGAGADEQWRAAAGINASPFTAKTGPVKFSAGANLDLGLLASLNYQFGQPTDQTQGKLIQNLITSWVLSNFIVLGGPAALIAEGYRGIIDSQNSKLGLGNYLSPVTVGAYAQAGFDLQAKLGFESKGGTFGVKWPGSFNAQLTGDVEVDGKLNLYSQSRIGVEADLNFMITGDLSLNFMGIANLGGGASIGAQVSTEFIYDSGQLDTLRLSIGLTAKTSVLQSVTLSGLVVPLNGIQLPPALSSDVTLTAEYQIPLTQLKSQLQSELTTLTQGDLGSNLGGVFGIYQAVSTSMNDLLRQPIPYTVTASNSTSTSIQLGIKILGTGISFGFDYTKTTTSVIETGFVFNLQAWGVVTYGTVTRSISDLDFINQYWLCSAGCAFSGTYIQKRETGHDLFLHVTDQLGRGTGFNNSTGQVETNIPGSFYNDDSNGTSFIVLPLNVTGFTTTVNGAFAHDRFESYVLTIISLDGPQLLGQYANSASIYQGTIQGYNATLGNKGLLVSPIPGFRISQFFSSDAQTPPPTDPNGNPIVTVVFANGKITSTNPGEILAWTNITSTGPGPISSIRESIVLPTDWTLQPPWTPAQGAIHIFFQARNGNPSDITASTTITVTTGNPQIVTWTISNLTNVLGSQLLENGNMLVSIKLKYGLIGTQQPIDSYPRSYNATSNVSVWSDPSFKGEHMLAGSSALFASTINPKSLTASEPTILGLSPTLFYIVAGAASAIIVALATVGIFRRRKR